MKKLLFIYNLHAGKGALRGRLAPILDGLTQEWDVTVHPTRGAGDAAVTARDRAGEFDRIVCSGGDGTLHEVVCGLMELPPEGRPTIGYIPAGTTNDFSKNLELPRTLEELAVVAAAGAPRPVDVGSFNDTHFVYVAGFGAFTEVSYMTPQERKNLLGHQAYMLEGVKSLANIKSYRMRAEADDFCLEGDFIFGMVTNTTSVGGFRGLVNQDVSLNDGLFEMLLIRAPRNLIELPEIVYLLTTQNYESDKITFVNADNFTIYAEEDMAWSLDGEYQEGCSKIEVENIHNAINILVNREEN